MRGSQLSMLLALAACATEPRREPAEAEPRTNEAWETCFTRSSGWNGGDIAHALEIGGGRTLWLFGDSLVGPVREGARVGPESRFVRGAVAWHATGRRGAAPAHVEFGAEQRHDGVAAIEWARPASADWPDDAWLWLMGDGALTPGPSGPQLVLFASVFGPAGHPEGMWNFRRLGGVILRVDDPGAPPPRWRVEQRRNPLVTPLPRHGEPPRRSDDWGAAVVAWPDEGVSSERRFYVFGVRTFEDGDRGLLLARCEETALASPELWEFLDGAHWIPEASRAREILRGVPDEFTVQPVELDGRAVLVLVQCEPMLGARTLARTALRPWGPWSEPATLFTAPEPALDARCIVYASKGHAHLSAPGELLVSYAVNSSDFGQLFADASLYRPRFVSVPLARLPRPPDGGR